MKSLSIVSSVFVAGLLLAGSAMAQQPAPSKQKTDGSGAGPAQIGPASGAYKQKTEGSGAGPAMVGPGSGAFKQKTEGSGAGPTMVGPGSGAFKQR